MSTIARIARGVLLEAVGRTVHDHVMMVRIICHSSFVPIARSEENSSTGPDVVEMWELQKRRNP